MSFSGKNNAKISNRPSGGGDKLQGIPSTTDKRASSIRAIQTRGWGQNRNLIFNINQLGGVGNRLNSQFGSNAGGMSSSPDDAVEPGTSVPGTWDDYLGFINYQASYEDLNFLYTIPWSSKFLNLSGVSPQGQDAFNVTPQSFSNNPNAHRNPPNTNSYGTYTLNEILSASPQVNDIISPSWYSSSVCVAINKYEPSYFNQLYLDNSGTTQKYWQISNSGGVADGLYNQNQYSLGLNGTMSSSWLYLSIGSGIYFSTEGNDCIYSMNKTHAISMDPSNSDPNLTEAAYNTFIFIADSQDWSEDEAGIKLHDALYNGITEVGNGDYFRLGDPVGWHDFYTDMSNAWGNNSSHGNTPKVKFICMVIYLLINPAYAIYTSQVVPGTAYLPNNLNSTYLYYSQVLNNLQLTSGIGNPLDTPLNYIARGNTSVPVGTLPQSSHDPKIIFMFANWNSAGGIWTTEILYNILDGGQPTVPNFYKNQNGVFIEKNAFYQGNPLGPPDTYPPCPPPALTNVWWYIWSPDVEASNYKGEGPCNFTNHPPIF